MKFTISQKPKKTCAVGTPGAQGMGPCRTTSPLASAMMKRSSRRFGAEGRGFATSWMLCASSFQSCSPKSDLVRAGKDGRIRSISSKPCA